MLWWFPTWHGSPPCLVVTGESKKTLWICLTSAMAAAAAAAGCGSHQVSQPHQRGLVFVERCVFGAFSSICFTFIDDSRLIALTTAPKPIILLYLAISSSISQQTNIPASIRLYNLFAILSWHPQRMLCEMIDVVERNI